MGDTATIYVCGITPYDTTHLGHAFTYLSFDVLIRYWEYLGYPVRYVQNVTDIDDDIIRKGKQVGEDWLALGNRWTRHFIEDLRALNVRPPDVYPRATDVIPQMFEAIDRLLIDKGYAYAANGNVYYHVAANPHFGQVSGLAPRPVAAHRQRARQLSRRPAQAAIRWTLCSGRRRKPGEPAWAQSLGHGPAGLAHRVLHHGHHLPGRRDRRARRRRRPLVSPSRMRDGPVHRHHRAARSLRAFGCTQRWCATRARR